MAVKVKRTALNLVINRILNAYKNGQVTLAQARYLVGHLIEGAANGDQQLIDDWLTPGRVGEWVKECIHS